MTATDRRQASTLAEERDFFLRSLEDLEAERQAGDIDEVDYRSLKDDYTARAADVIRRLEALGEELPVAAAKPRRVRRRRRRKPWTTLQKTLVVLMVACLAAAAGWQFSHRSSGGGSGRLSASQVSSLLNQASSVATRNPVQALADYRRILQVYPEQPQALTEEGWLLAQGGQLGAGEADLRLAEQVDPSWDLPHGYRGIVLFGQDDYAGAVTELQYYLAHGPDPALAAQARTSLAAAQKDLAATQG